MHTLVTHIGACASLHALCPWYEKFADIYTYLGLVSSYEVIGIAFYRTSEPPLTEKEGEDKDVKIGHMIR